VQGGFAQGHDATMQPALPWDLPTLAGAGAIRSTARDLVTFLEAAMGIRRRSLGPAFALMLAERRPGVAPNVQTGLAWMIAGTPRGEIIFHDGGTGGFRTTMAFDPKKRRGVIVLTNAAREPSSNDLAIHMLIGTPVATP